MTKITIKLTSHEVRHLTHNHTFYDACEEENNVMIKVQKELQRIEKKKKQE